MTPIGRSCQLPYSGGRVGGRVLLHPKRHPLALVAVISLVAVPVVLPMGTPSIEEPRPSSEDLARVGAEGTTYERKVDGSVAALSWDRGDAEFLVERRVDGRWESIGSVGSLHEEGPDHGSRDDQVAAEFAAAEHISDPIVVGDADRVRIRVTEGSVAGLDLRVSDDAAPTSSGAAGALTPAATAVVIPGVTVITRSQWGADEAAVTSRCPEGPSYSSEVRFGVVHHSAGAGASSPAGSAAVVRGFQQHHIFTNGWCDIGYNAVVDQWGQVFEGRVGGLDRNVIGAHAGGFNSNSFGIAMIGDYSGTRPSTAALQSVSKVLAWRLGLAGVRVDATTFATSAGNDIHPAGETISLPTIVGHRDVGATSCPGNGGESTLPYIRFLTWLLQHGAPAAPTAEWTPSPTQPLGMILTEHGAIQPAGGQPDVSQPTFLGWPSQARDIEASPTGGGWVLFSDGTIRSYGGAAELTGGPYWPGGDYARDLVVSQDGARAYVLDGFGGMHPLNGAPPMSGPYWWGWDIAIKAVLPGNGSTGYLLDAYGAIHSLNGATPITGNPYWPGWRIARDIAAPVTGSGVYLLDGYGGIYALGGAPPITVPYLGYDAVVDLEVTANGAWTMMNTGRMLRSGSTPALSVATMAGVLAPRRVAFAIQPPDSN